MSKLAKYLVPALAGTAVFLGGTLWLANSSLNPSLNLARPAPPQVKPPGKLVPPVSAEVSGKADILRGGGPDLILAAAPGAPSGGFGLGRPALPEEIVAWDIDVRPDGMGLPEGSGDVWTGEEIYVAKCASCHGDFGEAVGRWPQLAGGDGTLRRDDPVKTVGSYWPYLSTVFDYVNRAMPFGEAQSLTPDEVYAITAYLLYLNDEVGDDFELSRETFAGIRLPNEDGFFMDDRAETELPVFSGEVCMTDCTDGPVQVTMRARVLDVTPGSGVVTEAAAATDTSNAVTEDDASAGMAAVVAAEPEDLPVTGTGEVGEAVVEASQAAAEAADAAPDPALVAEGEALFRQCASCHEVGEGARNRAGPVLNGVVGHPIGAVEGFRYSSAMQERAGETWTEEALAAFLADPRGWLPGTKMSFRGLRDEEDAAAIIAYLSSFGE